nr:MAG TPA: hypothetical protein [Caudoviricetes sp.]
MLHNYFPHFFIFDKGLLLLPLSLTTLYSN